MYDRLIVLNCVQETMARFAPHLVLSVVLLWELCRGSFAASLSGGLPNAAVSPCPAIFQYASDSIKQQIYGIIDTREQPVDKVGTLELHLSIAGELHSVSAREQHEAGGRSYQHDTLYCNKTVFFLLLLEILQKYVGSIEAIEDSAQILQQFGKGRGVTYRVNFPIQEPLPKVTKVIFNDRELCTGPADRGSFVSAVTLRHFLRSDSCKDKCDRTKLVVPTSLNLKLTPPAPAPATGTAIAPLPVAGLPKVVVPKGEGGPVSSSSTPQLTGDAPAVQHEYQRTIERKEETNNPQDNSTSVKYIREEITYRKQVISPGGATAALQADELRLPAFVSDKLT